jgi:SAM-dependent methyltransferase
MSTPSVEDGRFASHSAQDEILRRMEQAENYNQWLLDRSRPYLGARVLDAGAGTGTFTGAIANGRELVVAAEADPVFVDALRHRFAALENVVVIESDVADLRADQISTPVDSIACFNVLEHVRDDAAALSRFCELLVPGGTLLLLVPAHPALFGSIDRVVAHERRYDKDVLRRRLDVAGFGVERLRLVNPLGAIGWFVSSRVLKRTTIPGGPLRIFDRLVPVLRALDRVEFPIGLSIWAVARKPAQDQRS